MDTTKEGEKMITAILYIIERIQCFDGMDSMSGWAYVLPVLTDLVLLAKIAEGISND